MTSYPRIERVLRRQHPSPSGGRLTAYRWGRKFLVVGIDRWPTTDWPEEAAEVLHPLADKLAWLALYRRPDRCVFISGFKDTGQLHTPVECAQQILEALLDADHGNLVPARRISAIAGPLVDELNSLPNRASKLRAAPGVVDRFIHQVQRAKASMVAAPRLNSEYQTAVRALSDWFNSTTVEANDVLWAWEIAGLGDYCPTCADKDVPDPTRFPWDRGSANTYLYRCDVCGRCWTCSWAPSQLNKIPKPAP